MKRTNKTPFYVLDLSKSILHRFKKNNMYIFYLEATFRVHEPNYK